MVIKALLVALSYYLIAWINFGIGVFHFNRPIIVGPLIGLVLGDLQTGIILGATFESIFLGVIAVGGTVPADATIGATMGTAIAILTGSTSDTAMAVAVPVSIIGVMLSQISKSVILPLFVTKIDEYAQQGNKAGMVKLHWIMSFLFSLLQAITIFFAVWLGSNALSSILNQIPSFVSIGFKAAGKMLPAVGFALLLNMLFNKKLFPFFFLGFVLCIYLKLPSLAIAIIAIVIATSQYNNMQRSQVAVETYTESTKVDFDDEEDFFNE